MKLKKYQKVYLIGACFTPTTECKKLGIVGFAPIFTNKRKAKRFAKKRYEVIMMEVKGEGGLIT
jgi:hypothetical protein